MTQRREMPIGHLGKWPPRLERYEDETPPESPDFQRNREAIRRLAQREILTEMREELNRLLERFSIFNFVRKYDRILGERLAELDDEDEDDALEPGEPHG